MRQMVLRGTFCVLCPLHQERYEQWCYLCGRVLAIKYGWNARPIPWYVDTVAGDPMHRIVQRDIDELRN